MQKPTLEKGLYKHYKGETYEVLDVVLHTETQEWLVLYKAHSYEFKDESSEEVVFVRPFEMFVEDVTHKGEVHKRFTYCS